MTEPSQTRWIIAALLSLILVTMLFAFSTQIGHRLHKDLTTPRECPELDWSEMDEGDWYIFNGPDGCLMAKKGTTQ
jgi:hypothetical protein